MEPKEPHTIPQQSVSEKSAKTTSYATLHGAVKIWRPERVCDDVRVL